MSRRSLRVHRAPSVRRPATRRVSNDPAGSGKTAAFVLPILKRLLTPNARAGTRALVLTPTRELAAQVHEHLVALGRLLDHMNQPWLGIDRLEVLVLDEAERDKKNLLLEMLDHDDVDTALVFARTKHRANRLAKFLDSAGIPCDRIHGNRSQPQREAVLAAFKTGRIQVLVATDIAARGIDVEALPYVINFDVPLSRAALPAGSGRAPPKTRVTNVTKWPTTGVGPEPGGPAARPSTLTGARRISGLPEKKRMSTEQRPSGARGTLRSARSGNRGWPASLTAMTSEGR